MSSAQAQPELSVREQRKKQLKNINTKNNANAKTDTNIIYNLILKEYENETKRL